MGESLGRVRPGALNEASVGIQELVTRQFAGHDENGDPIFHTTRHGVPAPPETLAAWIELRLAYFGASRVVGRGPGAGAAAPG